ncbi:MAG TPA: hypothetical protein VHF22_03295, partial [Planctomycetota bacterium]|nr:hypothetical protein [Planctomycetota bacterium]
IARELGASVAIAEELAPGATPDSLRKAVRAAARPAGGTVVAVGHQPDCSRIAAALTGEPEPQFPPAGSVAIRLAS